MEKQETIADIVAQIRAAAYIQNADTPQSVLRLADRIEAAWKREKAEHEALALSIGGMVEASRHKQVGNAAQMREALENIYLTATKAFFRKMGYDVACGIIRSAARRALSTPLRNCDVGTEEEQTRRLRQNCNRYKPSCIGCPYYTDITKVNCWLHWAQMPYEEKEGCAK